MPGVLLIEAMAQTSGWLVVASNGFERMAFLPRSRMPSSACLSRPATSWRSRQRLLHEGSGYAITKANITLDGKSICDATLTLRILDFPNNEMKLRMREAAARVGFPTEVPANG